MIQFVIANNPVFVFMSKATMEHVVKLRSRSKVYLKSLIRDLDLELEAIIAMSPPTHHPLNFSEQNNIEISSCMN